jgi:hypothetical protein
MASGLKNQSSIINFNGKRLLSILNLNAFDALSFFQMSVQVVYVRIHVRWGVGVCVRVRAHIHAHIRVHVHVLELSIKTGMAKSHMDINI